MKVPRKEDVRAEDLRAYINPFFDGLRIIVMARFRGKYVENAHLKDLKNLDRAWSSQFGPTPMWTISHGKGMLFTGSP